MIRSLLTAAGWMLAFLLLVFLVFLVMAIPDQGLLVKGAL